MLVVEKTHEHCRLQAATPKRECCRRWPAALNTHQTRPAGQALAVPSQAWESACPNGSAWMRRHGDRADIEAQQRAVRAAGGSTRAQAPQAAACSAHHRQCRAAKPGTGRHAGHLVHRSALLRSACRLCKQLLYWSCCFTSVLLRVPAGSPARYPSQAVTVQLLTSSMDHYAALLCYLYLRCRAGACTVSSAATYSGLCMICRSSSGLGDLHRASGWEC